MRACKLSRSSLVSQQPHKHQKARMCSIYVGCGVTSSASQACWHAVAAAESPNCATKLLPASRLAVSRGSMGMRPDREIGYTYEGGE